MLDSMLPRIYMVLWCGNAVSPNDVCTEVWSPVQGGVLRDGQIMRPLISSSHKPSVGAQFWEVGQWGKVSLKGVLGPCLFWLLLLVCCEVSNSYPLHYVLLPSGQENVDWCLWNHEPIFFFLIFCPSTGVFRNIAPFSTSASLSVKFQRDNSTWKVLAI